MKHEHYILCQDGKKRQAIQINCQNCKKDFWTRKRKTQRKFCNKKCQYNFGRIEIKCKLCGKKTIKKKSSLVNSKHSVYFCSRKCKDEGQKLSSGIVEIMPNHYGSGYNQYKKLIKRSINPECIDCKENRKYLLCVHHIDSDRSNNNITNLEIVCFNCHARRHLQIDENNIVFNPKVLTPRNILNYM